MHVFEREAKGGGSGDRERGREEGREGGEREEKKERQSERVYDCDREQRETSRDKKTARENKRDVSV